MFNQCVIPEEMLLGVPGLELGKVTGQEMMHECARCDLIAAVGHSIEAVKINCVPPPGTGYVADDKSARF